jgi:hypothetical protein
MAADHVFFRIVLPVAVSTTPAQDLSLWLYSLALLRITPSPLWCTSYVEASYNRLTASGTHPQVRSSWRHCVVRACQSASTVPKCTNCANRKAACMA